MHVCMCVCVCVCMYVYIYIYIYIYKHFHASLQLDSNKALSIPVIVCLLIAFVSRGNQQVIELGNRNLHRKRIDTMSL